MPCFAGKIESNRIIVDVIVSEYVLPDQTVTQKDLLNFKALWDNGAQTSCISKNVAKKLNLNSIGEGKMKGVNGEFVVKQYCGKAIYGLYGYTCNYWLS